MSKVFIEIIIIFVLILLNGILALAEIAIVSARKARLQSRADDGDLNAKISLALIDNSTDFLATVQIGITLIGVFAGVFGGATISEYIAVSLSQIPTLAPYEDIISIGVVVIIITYFTLVLGELVPKRLALSNPEHYALLVAIPMRFISGIMRPLVILLSISTNFILRLLGKQVSDTPIVTQEEIKVMIQQGAQAGVFEAVEEDMLSRVMRLGDRRIDSILVPRTEIVWLDLEDPVYANLQKISESVHTRFPVARANLDNVIGIVQAKDLLAVMLRNQSIDIESCLIDPIFVPESMPILRVMELFKGPRINLALVIDEFGGLQGLVTINDILEAIVGEIGEWGEPSEPEIVYREDGTLLIDGMLPIDELKELLHVDVLPREEQTNYQTLSGFIMAYLGKIPAISEHFEWGGYRFEIIDMDGFRVDKVLVDPGEQK